MGVQNLREFSRELTVRKDLLLHFLTTGLVCQLFFNHRHRWLRDAWSSVLEQTVQVCEPYDQQHTGDGQLLSFAILPSRGPARTGDPCVPP